jgi:hypothetical protein
MGWATLIWTSPSRRWWCSWLRELSAVLHHEIIASSGQRDLLGQAASIVMDIPLTLSEINLYGDWMVSIVLIFLLWLWMVFDSG